MLLVTSHTHLWHGRKHPVTLRRENHNPPGHDQAKEEAVDWPPALPRAQEKGQGFGLQSEEGKNNAQGVQEKGKPLGQEGAVCREEESLPIARLSRSVTGVAWRGCNTGRGPQSSMQGRQGQYWYIVLSVRTRRHIG